MISPGIRIEKALWLWLGVAAAVVPAWSQDSSGAGLEYQIKATFLYNFAKFVEWPAEKVEANSPILVGVYGKDPFGSILDQTLRGKTVNGKLIEVHRLTGLESVRQYHILFIGSAEKKHLGQILSAVGDGSVMTIGESENFAQEGGMVNLVKKDNSVGLEINVSAAGRARIQISSKLLKVARVVQEKGPAGGN